MLRSLWASRAPMASWLPRRPLTAGLSGSAAAGTPPPYVQHVRIRTRRRWRNAAVGAGVMYMCWTTYVSRVLLPPLVDMVEEEGNEHDREPIFVPLPFTFQVVESRPYKGTDPEWQEYIRIARDRDLLMKIRNDMLETVRVAAEANPILRQRCGREMKVRKHWLDLDFPYRPPPKIMRNGLLLKPEGGLDLVTAEVDTVTMMRISRALWPEPVALSATSFLTTLWRENMQNLARLFGIGDDPQKRFPPPPFQGSRPLPPGQTTDDLNALLKKISEDTRALNDKVKEEVEKAKKAGAGNNAGSANNGNASAPAAGAVTGLGGLYPTTPAPTRPQPASSPKPPGDWDEGSGILNARDLIPFQPIRSSIDSAWRDFRKKLAETWLPLRPQPPGGSVGVSGLVELQSPSSRIMIEVTAFWDPKTRKYDAPTTHMKLRSIRPRNQRPL